MAKPEVSAPGLQPYRTPPAGNDMIREDRDSARVGWVVFAAAMMILVGSFNAIEGFVALLNGNWLASNTALPITFDYTTWGWTWLIFGSVVALAGIGVLAGQMWARVVGVVFAGLDAVAQLVWLPAYPVWGVIVIAVDVIVIWALTVHGGALRDA